MIGVDEALLETARELAAQRRFACAHEPDQKEIAAVKCHRGIVLDRLFAPTLSPRAGRGSKGEEPRRYFTAVIDSRTIRGVRKISSSDFSVVRSVFLNR